MIAAVSAHAGTSVSTCTSRKMLCTVSAPLPPFWAICCAIQIGCEEEEGWVREEVEERGEEEEGDKKRSSKRVEAASGSKSTASSSTRNATSHSNSSNSSSSSSSGSNRETTSRPVT